MKIHAVDPRFAAEVSSAVKFRSEPEFHAEDIVGTQTRTRSNRKYTTKSPHTRNGRQSSMCHNCSINIH